MNRRAWRRTETVQRWLSARHDAELADGREAPPAEALATPEAQSFTAAMDRLDGLLEALEATEPRPGFTARVMQRLPAPAPVRRWAFSPSAVLAATTALVFGAFMGLGTAPTVASETSEGAQVAQITSVSDVTTASVPEYLQRMSSAVLPQESGSEGAQ